MYNCIVRVRHVSPHGADYYRVHIVPVRGTLSEAVRLCGACPPDGVLPYLYMQRGAAEIQYGDDHVPVCHDPAAIKLHFDGLQGGVYIHVPYQCSYENLVHFVIPCKLKKIGVHPFDVHGALEGKISDLYGNGLVPELWWTKLRKHVRFAWPSFVTRGVISFQRALREWQMQKEWTVLEQGFEPWTNSS